MLLSSWTRVARGKPVPHLASSVPTSSTSKANLSRPFTPCRPQRRNSSSKPSNSQNGDTSPLAAPSDVDSKKTLSTSSTQPRKRLVTRTSRQKTRDAMLETTPQIRQNGTATELPTVPSTKNLHPHDIHVASFFSIYRPISVTAPVPTNSSINTFSSIFTPKLRGAKPQPAEVIYTLSSTVQNLEKATAQADDHSVSPSSPHNQDHLEPLRMAVTQASSSNAEPVNSTNLDGQPNQGAFNDIHELAKKFQPFVPPPPPVPVTGYASQTDGDMYQRHNGIFTNSPDHLASPQIILPFLERMRERHIIWEEYMERSKGQTWRAISVKRQRKLKMKKHKYKKLMRRTRNLRRRLDRL